MKYLHRVASTQKHIMTMNDNINMGSTIEGSVNARN